MIPVIVVTSRDDKRTAAEALAIGVFAYVPKPCEYLSFEHIVGLTPDRRAA
jgi:response regulator of citrate/malate metabolism